MSIEVVFRIDNWTPKTLPMERLGQYLVELAELYGEAASVHFKAVRKGSAQLVATIDSPAVPKVRDRLAVGRRPIDVEVAYEKIDRMLADDNAKGAVRIDGVRGNVIIFPGRDRPAPVSLGAVRQLGFLDGEIVRIGGRDRTVHIVLQDGDTLHSGIFTDRSIARQLGPLILGPTVRLWGLGVWRRTALEKWEVESFRVSRFEELKDFDVSAAISELQSLPGVDWHKEPDPIATLLRERHGDERQDGSG